MTTVREQLAALAAQDSYAATARTRVLCERLLDAIEETLPHLRDCITHHGMKLHNASLADAEWSVARLEGAMSERELNFLNKGE